MGAETEPREILPYDPYIDTVQPVRPAPPDPRLVRIEHAFSRLGITDTEVRRRRVAAGIPWLTTAAGAVLTTVLFTLLNLGQVSFGDVLVGLLYAGIITLLVLVLIRAGIAIALEHRVLAWVVAIGGAVLVVVYWVLVHFITVAADLLAAGSLWRAALLAGVGIAVAASATLKDAGTREWVAGPLRAAQVGIVGFPPEAPKPPRGSWKALVKNPAATAMVAAAAITGALAARRKK